MTKNKEPNLKKIYKEINDIGKKLSHSSIYLIEGEECTLLSSSLKELNETFHITKAILNEEYKEYLFNLALTVKGSELGPVLGGTGVSVSVKNNLMSAIGFKTNSKTKEKTQLGWIADYKCCPKERYEILKNIGKLENIFNISDLNYRDNYYSKHEYDVEELIALNKFVLDIHEELQLNSLKITNKMIKTLNKKTKKVTSYVTNPIQLKKLTHNINQRLHIIETEEESGIIVSYYPFIDR